MKSIEMEDIKSKCRFTKIGTSRIQGAMFGGTALWGYLQGQKGRGWGISKVSNKVHKIEKRKYSKWDHINLMFKPVANSVNTFQRRFSLTCIIFFWSVNTQRKWDKVTYWKENEIT